MLARAIERELGPIHIGLFMELHTAQSLLRGRQAGDWAMAFATRGLIVHPVPGYAAAGLGIDVLSGAAQYAIQALEQMDPEEILDIAQGFWRGLTDGKGVQGLLGFSPAQAIHSAIEEKASSEPPPENAAEAEGTDETEDEPAAASNGSSAGPLT